MNNLEQENAFYEAHRDEFREKYLNMWLLLSGNKFLGAYENISGAVEEAQRLDLEPGHIMIHKPANDDITMEIGPIISTSIKGYDEDAEANAIVKIVKGKKKVCSYAY